MIPRNRPHFIRSSTRQRDVPDKNKLLCRVLKKLVTKRIKISFRKIIEADQNQKHALSSIVNKVDKNLKVCKLLAWNIMKANIPIKRKDETILKNVLIIHQSLRKNLLMKSFMQICRFGYQKQNLQANKVLGHRKQILCRTLKKVQNRRILQSFYKIKVYRYYAETRLEKLKRIDARMNNKSSMQMLRAWIKIGTSLSGEEKDIEYQLGAAMKELDSLRRQMMEKDQVNRQLEQKITIYQENARIKTISDIQTNGRGSSRSIDHHKRASSQEKVRSYSFDKQDKKSENGSQQSVLSWINNSFLSFKSGRSSKTISGVECFCVYRQKYSQYKYQSASLKNQLQIIKNELDVTKDVNQHLQQEISSFYGIQDRSYEVDRLRNQCKQLRRERDELKQKMFKYQKYVAGLKVEFKKKIESLYRSIKKNQ